MHVLREKQDFYDLTMAYMKKCHEQNVMHTEPFFDPQGHTSRGVEFKTVIEGISEALADAKKNYGITSGLIMSYLRHLPEDDAIATWNEAKPYRDKFIGVGLDSSELDFPPEIFSRVFQMAEDVGKKKVAHAGEEGPPSYVRQALDILQVHRIDHGNRAMEDSALVERLVNEQMPLTVCPLSNVRLKNVDDIKNHPIVRMLHAGVKATVNPDDSAYFGGYFNENYDALFDNVAGFTIAHAIQTQQNAIEGSFAPDERKSQMLRQLERFKSQVQKHGYSTIFGQSHKVEPGPYVEP
ncbi:MAG: adenosine deaminase [Micavibrio sp.]|nr:adenosine deaminase [Micavibrio sp.]